MYPPYNTWSYYKERVYNLNEEGHDTSDLKAAWNQSQEVEDRIPIGIFYKEERDTFEKKLLGKSVPAEKESTPSLDPAIKDFI